MKEVNAKQILVDALLSSTMVSERVMNPEKEQDIYFTYVTANGLITGKEMDYEILEVDMGEEFHKSVAEAVREKESVNVFSITDAYARNYAHLCRKEGMVIKNQGTYKILEDVTISRQGGESPVRTNAFVLFLDQVIGILPGKVNL